MKYLKLYEEMNIDFDDIDEEEYDQGHDIIDKFIRRCDNNYSYSKNHYHCRLKINENRWNYFINYLKDNTDIKWVSNDRIDKYNSFMDLIKTVYPNDIDFYKDEKYVYIYCVKINEERKIFFRFAPDAYNSKKTLELI